MMNRESYINEEMTEKYLHFLFQHESGKEFAPLFY